MSDLLDLQLLWLDLAQNQRYEEFITNKDCSLFLELLANGGLSFLTQGLPSIGKALDRFHATNAWNSPDGFDSTVEPVISTDNRKETFSSLLTIPVFLSQAIRKALEGNPTAVDCVRQLSYVFYKLEVPYDEGVRGQFLDQFVSTDHELGLFDFDSGPASRSALIKSMRSLICQILSNEDPLDIIPSHGGGATACRTPNYEKYHKLRYYQKLDDVFSYDEFFFFSPTHLIDEYEKLENSPSMDPQARVCLVPKDSRGPRIISCEPAELLYIQQGLMKRLYKILENHPLTRGQLNFTDQTINQNLARIGSLTGAFATMDLADASDRVSLELIERVFPPNWFRALEACRSETTLLPDGRVVKLNKFAPMGSSCCFPVEALVFWACAVAAIRSELGQYGTACAYVYGDDIIIDSHLTGIVTGALESIGLKVNRDKTFSEGPFRESCGGDYYLGVDVTPVRLRKRLGTSLTSIEVTAEFINNLINKFGYTSIHPVIRTIENRLKYVYPRTLLVLPGTIRTSCSASNDVHFVRRYNKNLQLYEYRIPRTACKVKQRHDPSWAELLRKELSKGILNRDPEPYLNRVTILDSKLDPGQYTDPHSVVTKWEWVWLG